MVSVSLAGFAGAGWAAGAAPPLAGAAVAAGPAGGAAGALDWHAASSSAPNRMAPLANLLSLTTGTPLAWSAVYQATGTAPTACAWTAGRTSRANRRIWSMNWSWGM